MRWHVREQLPLPSQKIFAGDIDTLHPYAPRSSEASYKPMGDTQATNAASYFSAYYKQDEVKDEKEASSAAPSPTSKRCSGA